jgi:hypothetical protein
MQSRGRIIRDHQADVSLLKTLLLSKDLSDSSKETFTRWFNNRLRITSPLSPEQRKQAEDELTRQDTLLVERVLKRWDLSTDARVAFVRMHDELLDGGQAALSPKQRTWISAVTSKLLPSPSERGQRRTHRSRHDRRR